MIGLSPPFRSALIEDAGVLAVLVNYAGEGLPVYLWSTLAEPGQDVWDVGRRRAARKDCSFSYRNAIVIERDGQCAGALIGYEIPERPKPVPDDMPAMFVPLQELENLAPGTWYVNVLAVRPQFRNLGLGRQLLDLAQRVAQSMGKRGLSVVVSNANDGARRLYERCGYSERARLPMVKEKWVNDGTHWLLLTKDLDAVA
jgi:ribosomal protein S18 acetylase RimI-like enzyme